MTVKANESLRLQKEAASKEKVKPDEVDGTMEQEVMSSALMRVVMNGLNAMAMSFAWCLLWGTRWLIIYLDIPALRHQEIMGRVMLALILSAVGAFAVKLLDIVDDAHSGVEDSRSGAQAIQMLVNALGILIGFSWEHCFDGSVGAIASRFSNKVAAKFFMGLVIAFVIIPVWRNHILTKELSYQKIKEQKEMRKQHIREDKERARTSSAVSNTGAASSRQ